MGSPLSRLMKKRTTGRMVSLTRSTPPSNVPLLTVAKDHLTVETPATTFADFSLYIPGTRLLLNYGFQWPVDLRVNSAVKIVYQTGHGLTAATLPPTLVQAVMLLGGHCDQNR